MFLKKDNQTMINYKEVLLSTPIEPRDIFFGEFLGRFSLYCLIILIMGPFVTTLLNQINPKMNIFHYIVFLSKLNGLPLYGI